MLRGILTETHKEETRPSDSIDEFIDTVEAYLR